MGREEGAADGRALGGGVGVGGALDGEGEEEGVGRGREVLGGAPGGGVGVAPEDRRVRVPHQHHRVLPPVAQLPHTQSHACPRTPVRFLPSSAPSQSQPLRPAWASRSRARALSLAGSHSHSHSPRPHPHWHSRPTLAAASSQPRSCAAAQAGAEAVCDLVELGGAEAVAGAAEEEGPAGGGRGDPLVQQQQQDRRRLRARRDELPRAPRPAVSLALAHTQCQGPRDAVTTGSEASCGVRPALISLGACEAKTLNLL
eukprot:1569961-Rhodomonas_salina.2